MLGINLTFMAGIRRFLTVHALKMKKSPLKILAGFHHIDNICYILF